MGDPVELMYRLPFPLAAVDHGNHVGAGKGDGLGEGIPSRHPLLTKREQVCAILLLLPKECTHTYNYWH